jgi:hypothetical protein
LRLTERAAQPFAQRTYTSVDGTDNLSCRPDIPVRTDSPPTFLLQAEDDHVDGVEQSLAYYVALQKAGVPTEMHLYAQGGHAFGLRASKLPIAQWPRLVETWLVTSNGGRGPRTLIDKNDTDPRRTRSKLAAHLEAPRGTWSTRSRIDCACNIIDL